MVPSLNSRRDFDDSVLTDPDLADVPLVTDPALLLLTGFSNLS